MKHIKLDDISYLVMRNERDALNMEELNEAWTDYFKDFDYVLGDYAYGKLRLKGFNSKTNKNFKAINDIDKVDEYLEKYCAYQCRYFLISKDNNEGV